MTRPRKAKPEVTKSQRNTRPAKNEGDEYATFETALKKVLTVPREEMQKRLADAAADRAASDED